MRKVVAIIVASVLLLSSIALAEGWTCPNCGKCHARDMNAAINIRNEGMRIVNALT